MARSVLTTVGLVAAGLLLTSCSSGTPESALTEQPPVTVTAPAVTTTVTETTKSETTKTVTETVTTSAKPTTPSGQPDAVAVGTEARSGGIAVTVSAMEVIPSYDEVYNRDVTTVSPRAGAKLIKVTATVLNDTKGAIDLTCNYVIDAKLVDDKDRNFEAIQDLYKIEGNPECNAQLQPGFDSPMTWIYEVPADAVISGIGFRDVTDFDADFPYAGVIAPAGL